MFVREPLVNFETVANRSIQSLESLTERIGKFLKGSGLKLSEENIKKYFTYKIKEPVSPKLVSEVFYQLKEQKWLQPRVEKRGEEALKKILGRKRVRGKSSYTDEH